MACFMFARQKKKNFLEQLLIAMDDVWWLRNSDVIERQDSLETPNVNLLDELLYNLILAHYYSVNDKFAISEYSLEKSQQVLEQFQKDFPKEKRVLECARIAVTFSNLLTISRKMRSNTIGKFMNLYTQFKTTLSEERKLQKTPAGIIAAALVELAHCDIHFRLGPGNHHTLDKIHIQADKLKKLRGLLKRSPTLCNYILRALGDIEYHKGRMTFLKGENEAAYNRFKKALQWYNEVDDVMQHRRDPHCRSQFCIAMILATGCAGEEVPDIDLALDEIRNHQNQTELPLVVKHRLGLLEGSLNLFKDRSYELTDSFLKEFGFQCEDEQSVSGKEQIVGEEAKPFILFSFELLELIERKLRFLANDRKWQQMSAFFETCRVPVTIISTFSHIFRIMKTLRIICSKKRSSVRRHESLKKLVLEEVELEYGSLKLWLEMAFCRLLKYFARNGNSREFNLLLNRKPNFLTISDGDIAMSMNLLDQCPVVSTNNGFFLCFDNFRKEEKNEHSAEQEKDMETLRNFLGVSVKKYLYLEQKRKDEILEEIAQKSSLDNHPSLNFLLIFFIGHGEAYKRETEFVTSLGTADGGEITMCEIKETINRNFSGHPLVAWIIVDTCRGKTELTAAGSSLEEPNRTVLPGEAQRRFDVGDFVDTDDLFEDGGTVEELNENDFANGGADLMLSAVDNNNTGTFDDDDDDDVGYGDDLYSLVSGDQNCSFMLEETLEDAERSSDNIMEPDIITPVSTPNIMVTYATLNLCTAFSIRQKGNSPFMECLLKAVEDEKFYSGKGPWNLRQLQRTLNFKMSKLLLRDTDKDGKSVEKLQRSTGEDSLRRDFVLSKDS